MTEKTEGGGQERQEGGPGRRDGAPPPRSYSEFMRSLAAKYNNENPAEYVDKYEDKNTYQPIHYSGPAGLRQQIKELLKQAKHSHFLLEYQ